MPPPIIVVLKSYLATNELPFNFSKENGFKSIRLDTFSGNPQNNIFYQSLDFKKLENIYFREQSELPFYCYEKVL